MEFEIDFGSITSQGTTGERGPLCASLDGRVAPLSDEECVFQVRGSDQVHVMTLDVLRAMDTMRAFRHREDQISTIENKLPELKGRRDAIGRVVEGLESRGLVVTAETFIAQTLEQVEPRATAPSPIVIRTCDRPASLERLLVSLSEAGCEQHVVVVDDSRESASIGKNGELVAASGLDACHLDRRWRDRLGEEIAGAAGCAPAVAAELLGGVESRHFGGGAAWNAAVLLTAGQRPILLDDDMRWDLRRLRGSNPQSVSVGSVRTVPMQFAADQDQLSEHLEPEPADWMGRHGRLCGQPLRDVLNELDATIDPETMAGRSERGLRGLLDSAIVKTTRFGYYGAAGMDTRLWFHLAESNVSDLWEDRARYYEFLANPLLTHGFRVPQVVELSHFTPTCIDNAELLPPTAPSGRGEDLVFATFLRYLYPNSVALQLPTLIAHDRPEPRGAENPDAFVPWASRFFGEYALAHLDQCEAAAAEDRARQLASRFADIAAADVARRKEILREFLGFMRSQIVSQLQQVLTAGTGSPDFWQQEIRDWIEANGRALTEIRAPRLRGWPEDLDADGCAEALAVDARRYARWLEHWPAMWRAAEGRFDDLIRL